MGGVVGGPGPETETEYTCEAGVGWDTGGPAPRVLKCGRPAKLYGWAALCDDCAPKILKGKK